MRSLALLGLIALSTLPLAARDHDRGPWRGRGPWLGVVMEGHPDRYDRSYDRYDRDGRYDRYDRDGRWDRDDDRWEGRPCRDDRPRYRAYDDNDVRVFRPRGLAPRWGARVVLRFGR